MVPEENRAEIFKFLDVKYNEAFELIPECDRIYINGEPFKFIENKNLDSFKFIQPGRRHLAFKYLEVKDLEAFKLVPENDRYKIFKYLEVKDIETFKLVPEKDRYQAFKDLEVKDIEAFKLISENDRYQALIYLDRESINNFKIMVCNGEDLDVIFKNSNDKILSKLKPGYIRFVKNDKYYYYMSASDYAADESSKNDFKVLREDLERYNKLKKYIYFEKISAQCRWCVFNYVDNKNIESFKLIPQEDRFCCFRYLDKKSYEEFQLISYEDRFRCFGQLDEKTRKAFDSINSEDQKLSLNPEIIEPKKEKEEE